MGRHLAFILLLHILWNSTEGGNGDEALVLQFTQPDYTVYIYENSPAKTYVEGPPKMGIYMREPSREIRYRIDSGDHENIFKAEEYVLGRFCFLRIRTKGGSSATLNREVRDRYVLTVKAQEQLSSGEVQSVVTVQVLDINDLRPLFSPTSYTVSLPENTAVRTNIGKVMATDADVGKNAEHYFSFKEWTDVFSIHPTSGIITLTGTLDYEGTASYEMDVLVVDRGLRLYRNGDVAGSARLTVRVLPANDHAPVITAVTLSTWDTGEDPTYAVVSVQDGDRGRNGEIASLSIVDGDPQQHFRVIKTGAGSNEYKIKGAKEVEWRGRPRGFNLTLRARDWGSPPRYSSAEVVRVHPPQAYTEATEFEESCYRVGISEFAPPNSFVVMVRTRPRRSPPKYTLKSATDEHLGLFSINPSTGLITTAGAIKADQTRKYELDVMTNDGQAATKVIVEVIDENNNAPRFGEAAYNASVDENVPVGTSVLAVSASDLDDGENGAVTYSIVGGRPSPFAINHLTGVISSAASLDYELRHGPFLFRVRASDCGSPFRRETETTVSVTVNNLNDNRPLFENNDCHLTVPRSLALGEVITVVSAVDADDLGGIRYEIKDGDALGLFGLVPDSGVLFLKKPLSAGEAAEVPSHAVEVTANDGEYSSPPLFLNITAVAGLHLVHLKCVEAAISGAAGWTLFESAEGQEDVTEATGDVHSTNRHAPQFVDSSPGVTEVKENIPVGTEFFCLRATDADTGFNGRLVFVISEGNQDSCYSIDMDTGCLKIIEGLDREKSANHILNITVYDLGIPQKSASYVLKVIVLDINDNRPVFLQNKYSVEVSENSALGMEIVQVEAKVKNLRLNGMIRYRFLTVTNQLHIDENTGVVTVKGPLDREATPSLALKVSACNGGTGEPQQTSTVQLEVLLKDINDNSPAFFQPYYFVKVPEDVPLGTVVVWPEAQDPDLGPSGQVRYSLMEDGAGSFKIDKISGALRIAQNLDFEKRQVYNLTALVKDKGKPASLSSSCYIVVEVVDVDENFHRPSFPFFTASGSVSEDVPLGTTVLKVVASDHDSGRDGEIRYSTRGGSGVGVFAINEDSGAIYTKELLDYETMDHYWLIIYATDQGVVPLSTSIEVYIEVQDVNDNAPQTTEPVYYSSVYENSPKDTTVIQIEAVDPDTRTSEKLSYKITSGNPQGFFTIDPDSGLVTTTSRKLDREKQEEHVLEITVTDDVSPTKSTIVSVIVNVVDENDNSPQFLENIYKIKLPERNKAPKRQPIYRVIAKDDDESPYAEISYSIDDGDKRGKFLIEPQTGVVSSKEAFSAGEYYILSIKAVDSGRPQRSTTCQLHVEWIPKPEISDSDLEFEISNLTFSVMESVSIGHRVGVIATKSIQSPVWFKIKGGEDIRTGTIIVSKHLDAEQKSNYNLTVEGTDGSRCITAQVLILVIDTNEHRPQFSQSKYEISIPEETQPNTMILEIVASDKDEKSKLSYRLLSSTDPYSLQKFRLDQGFLYTTEKLDHETMQRHMLTLMVHDQGIPVKRNLARVIVNVLDSNDNAPHFTSSQYSAHLFETAAVGSAVLQVAALDKDRGKNAEINYSIESGNAGDTFVIDPLLGIISVAKELDHWRRNQFELTIKASDKGDPSLGMETTVHIVVTMPDNSKPKFPHGEIVVEISEAAPVGTFVSLVTASSQSLVLYQIKEGNVDGSFTINPHSGVIATLRLLDRETTQSYKLIIQATNMADTASNITVYVHLKDENDNAPVFTETEFFGIISESAAAKSVVLTKENTPLVICAADADADLNGRLVYEIADPLARNYFQLDSVTGAIRTLFSLDFEQIAVFHFTVQVHDSGFPRLFGKNTVNVTIQIMDYNDCPPKFSQDLYETNLFVPSYSGQKVISLNATDEDSPPNAKLLFSISDGNTGGKFRIDSSSGDIFVQNAAVLRSRYKLTVRVSDGRFASTAVVRVTAKHNQDQGPVQFTQKVYTASVRENSAESQTLALVSTVGRKMNEHLFYTILNQDRGFKIGRTSGLLFTTGIPFDREVQDTYDVLVGVTRESASPNILAHVLVKVTVEDVNDNPPVFVSLPYHALVQMDAEVGQVVRLVTAVDRDISRSAEIEYLLPDHDYFQVTSFGEISLKKSFEPQMLNAKFTISIVAQDKGEPSLSSTAEVVITVVNKATPVFEKLFYNIEIPENIPLHTSILQVHVSDSVGPKALYSIFEGDPLGHFFINLNSGVISVFHALDYEAHPAYKLRVRAMDSSTTAHSEVFVDIILQDVNDNAPVFEASLYNISLSESTAVGTAVLRVRALDSDFGTNREVLYQLLEQGGSVSPYFGIDQDTGVIVTTSFLDYETIPQHRLIIRAMDGGSPALSSEVSVIVHMSDINDNFPVFVQSHYRAAISELASQGQFVMCVRAFDVDTSDYYKLEYSFLSGNEQRHFSVDRKSGVIKILNHQRSKMEPLYNLTLAVTDGVFRSSAEVTVTVIRENLHSPSFAQKEYYIELVENSPIGTLVTEVKAIDSDAGLYGQVTYFIVNEVAIDKFTINADGQIYTAESFDRESPNEQSIFINVMAKDGGGKIGFCTVNVNLLDINDNAPQFHVSVYNGSIPWNVPKGFSVMKVKAVDRDEGRNGDIVYETYCEACHFEIHPLSGVLTTKASLFGFENFLFSFYVKAQDSGKPPKQSIVPVNIRVLPSHVSFLEVAMPMLTLEIPENLPVGTAIEAIQTDRKQFVTYSLVKGNTLESNQNDVFVVDSSTGKLKVSKRLDYETTEMFALTLLVKQNREGAELISSLNVKILLKDINDNSPQFDSDPYKSFVVENLPGGTSIIQLRATDLDAGLNGQVTYSLDEDQERADILELFAIESSTGWLTTVEELDWEKNERYSVSVVATDRGQEVQMMAKTRVDITVVDTNDNPPRFTQDIYRSEVREDDPVSTVITVLSATDPDSEETNRNISCYITGGDPLTRFGVEYIQNEWMVILRKPLDREERNNYLLNITATDGTHVVNTAVEIKVLDANDNSPVCEKALYVAAVPEDAPAGRVILRVSATDADSHANAEVSYWLSGDGAEHFSLEPVTGALKTLLPLDREERSKFELTAHAQDGGGRACQAGVVVTVDDINDNPPLFAPPYGSRFTVAENTEPGTYVAQIQATDPDSGMNGKVLYSLENSAGGLFSIHQQSGIMSLMKPLHKRAQDSYTLTVRATDQGSPQPRSTLGFLVVDVESAADSPPAFERRGYVVTVPEDITVGSRILSVSAVSTVVEKRPEISYCITGGNERGSFSIRSHTGDIFVIVGLDYETSHEHYLTVKATVAGKRALSDVATVRVNVTDVNDNSPVFSQRVYSAGVGEHATAGMVVLTVTARDADGPSNSRVHFSIISGNQGGSFIIDATSGELRVGRQLDREKISVHTLKVLASDGGNPPRSSSAKIHIDVLDVNDNPPVFCQTNYSLVIQENLPIGSSVLQLSASDSDGPLNGPPFSFALQQGSNSDSFSIKTNGTLVTTQHLSHRVQEHHVLRIQVADSGRPPLSSSTVISIMVVAQSAHPPTVLPLEVLVSTPGEQYTGRVLGRVHASDQDIHDTLTYSLLPPSQSHFSISSSDGRLLARQSLAVGHYPLNVSVSDGHFTTATRVNVHVRQVTQQMLNQSVAVRFAHVSPEEFINERWHDVQRAIRIITGVRRGDVQLVSIQPVEPAGSLDVLVALERGPPGLQESLLHKLNSIARIQQITGLHIVRVVKNRCASAVCPTNFCREVVTLDETSISAYSGAKFSFVSLQHNTSAICLCQGEACTASNNLCESNPCPEGLECLPDKQGDKYGCLCPGGEEEKCRGGLTLTFGENSFVKYRLLEDVAKDTLNLSLRLRTLSPHGTVMFTRGHGYSILEIVNARLQYRVVCGGDGRSITAVHRAQVDDGQWHSVSLGLDGNRAKLTLDRVHVASDVMLGKACSPKLGDVIFLGGHRHLASHRGRRSLPAIASLRGCLEAVELNGQTLALSSQAQSGAMVEDVEDVSPGCTMLPPMACSSNPCLNGGMCVPRSSGDESLISFEGYYCKCGGLFMGTRCEVSHRPCASNPCLYGGTCIEQKHNFYCKCKGRYSGQRCQIGPYCEDNPCHNAGTCVESLDGPVCQCRPGFAGETCLSDVDECVEDPCLNGGRCINTYGTFNCSCAVDFIGTLCEIKAVGRNAIVPTTWSRTLEGILGILLVSFSTVVTVLLFLTCRKIACESHKSIQEPEQHQPNQASVHVSCAEVTRVPVRPGACASSMPGSLLSSPGRGSGGGSAAAEQPEISAFNPGPVLVQRRPVAVCSVAPNLSPQLAVRSSSRSSGEGRSQVLPAGSSDNNEVKSASGNKDGAAELRTRGSFQSDSSDESGKSSSALCVSHASELCPTFAGYLCSGSILKVQPRSRQFLP
uniref:FAT atypical cadherin 1 n=1 Tax=Denticeps clupeoides TaxID=299321 RepID=A0AAY4AYK1_9TELE